MRAGALRHRITIQEEVVTFDSFNQPIVTWKDRLLLWAEAITTGGAELYNAQKVNAETNVLFRTRYNPSVTTLMRILYEGRICQILSINDVDGRHRELLISAKEVI